MDPKSICMVELREYPGSITVYVHKMDVHNVSNRTNTIANLLNLTISFLLVFQFCITSLCFLPVHWNHYTDIYFNKTQALYVFHKKSLVFQYILQKTDFLTDKKWKSSNVSGSTWFVYWNLLPFRYFEIVNGFSFYRQILKFHNIPTPTQFTILIVSKFTFWYWCNLFLVTIFS